MEIDPDNSSEARTDPRLRPALRWRHLAGAAWTAGNIFLVGWAGLNTDPVLAVASIGTFSAGVASLFTANRLDAIVGPTYVVASTVFTAKHLYNAITGIGAAFPAEWLHTGFGLGCTAGLVIGFYGKPLAKKLRQARPLQRLLDKLPAIKQGTLSAGVMNSAYVLEVFGGATNLYHGLVTNNLVDIKRGAVSLTMIGLWVLGDWMYGKSVNLQAQIKRDAQARMPMPG